MSVCTPQGQGRKLERKPALCNHFICPEKITWRLVAGHLETMFGKCYYLLIVFLYRSLGISWTVGPLLCPGTTIRMFWKTSTTSQWLLRNSIIQHFGWHLSATHNWAKATKIPLTFSGQVNVLILKHLYRFSHKEDFLSNPHRNVWRQHFYSQRKLFQRWS